MHLPLQLPLNMCLLFLATAACLGCGSEANQVQSRETASKSYQSGIAALESRDYQSAVEQLTIALEGGWLGYSTITAYTQRAIALAALGKFDQAHADLDRAETGEGGSVQTYVARTYVLEKQGKQTEAKKVWNRARRLDRSIRKIED